MKISSSFLHLEHSPALDQKIAEASEKIAKYFGDVGSLKWICYVKNNVHFAEVNFSAHHSDYHAKASSDNMYESINRAMARVKKQAMKKKEKFNRLHRGKSDLDLVA